MKSQDQNPTFPKFPAYGVFLLKRPKGTKSRRWARGLPHAWREYPLRMHPIRRPANYGGHRKSVRDGTTRPALGVLTIGIASVNGVASRVGAAVSRQPKAKGKVKSNPSSQPRRPLSPALSPTGREGERQRNREMISRYPERGHPALAPGGRSKKRGDGRRERIDDTACHRFSTLLSNPLPFESCESPIAEVAKIIVIAVSSFFLLPSSFFLLPSSFQEGG